MRNTLTTITLLLACHGAWAACGAVKVGFSNQHVPPYYMGEGGAEANPPGAAVDLIREMLTQHGCTMVSMRLPPLRIIQGLETGMIDIAPASVSTAEGSTTAYPLDKNGALDRDRALRMYTVVFVRSSDKMARDGEPTKLLAGKKLATNFGAPYAASLRQQGFEVDDGALNIARNFDKLKRNRVDAVIVSLTAPSDMDAVVHAQHGNDIVRLEKPIRQAHIWIAASRAFYTNNRELTESLWSWLGTTGRVRFPQILKKYE